MTGLGPCRQNPTTRQNPTDGPRQLNPTTGPRPGPATRLERRCDERGLTTLSWLLIVAAVAGLAALAVVLVLGVVEDASDDIASQNPRVTSAELEAAEVTEDARGELSPTGSQNDAATVAPVNATYGPKCSRLAVVYQGLDLGFVWHDAVAGNARPTGAANEAACEVTKS